MADQTLFDVDTRAVAIESVSWSPMSTIATATGIDVETGERVTFGGDWRALFIVAQAVIDELEPVAAVPFWSVINVEEVSAGGSLGRAASLQVPPGLARSEREG